MNIHEIAQKFVTELQADILQKEADIKMLQGAIQAVSVFHQRLTEAKEADEQDSKTKDSKPAAAAPAKK